MQLHRVVPGIGDDQGCLSLCPGIDLEPERREVLAIGGTYAKHDRAVGLGRRVRLRGDRCRGDRQRKQPANRQRNPRRVPELVHARVHSAAGWRGRPVANDQPAFGRVQLLVAALHRDRQLGGVGAWVEIEIGGQIEETHAVEGAPIARGAIGCVTGFQQRRVRGGGAGIFRERDAVRPGRGHAAGLRQGRRHHRIPSGKIGGNKREPIWLGRRGTLARIGNDAVPSDVQRVAREGLGVIRAELEVAHGCRDRPRIANPIRNVQLKRQPPVGIGLSRCRVDRR